MFVFQILFFYSRIDCAWNVNTVFYNNTIVPTLQNKYRQSDLPIFWSTIFWGGCVQDSMIAREVHHVQSAGSESV
jgi:hypothetical protein